MSHGDGEYRNRNTYTEDGIMDSCRPGKYVSLPKNLIPTYIFMRNSHIRIHVRMFITILIFEPRTEGNLGFLSLEEWITKAL